MKLKLCEIVMQEDFFDLSEFEKILSSKTAIKHYAYIKHDKDINVKTHYHFALRLIDSYDTKYIAKWFNISENYINKVKGRWSDMLKYLTHDNAKNKYQYAEDEVVSNFDFISEKNKLSDKQLSDSRKEEIIVKIANGDIRQYNYFDYMNVIEYNKYKSSIENAFKYRLDFLKSKRGARSMNCIYITGKSGTGKTTYAKFLAEDKNFSYYISSGSNDVLDGYVGQDCLILDDLRPSCLGLSDLLKMLDNNTSSSVKSRYYNKILECKLIIITSVLRIDEFFNNVFQEQKEPIVQLKRRCRLHLEFFEDYYVATCFNDELLDYDYKNSVSYENPVSKLYKKQLTTVEEQIEFLQNMLLSDSKMLEKNKNAFIQNEKYKQEKIPF